MIPRAAWIAAAVLVAAAILAGDRVVREMPDLEVYWRAADRARTAQPLYRADDEHYQFKYLPAFAVLSVPLAALPLQTAKQAWLIASVLLLVALVALSVALPPERRRPAWLLTLLVSMAMAKFYGHELILGQVNILFGVAVLLALHAMRLGREVPAGALLAFAIVVKPYAVIFLPWLLARRRAGSIAAAAGGVAAVLALPAVVYGIRETVALHAAWWRTVSESTAPNLLNADNVSIAAMYAKWIGPGGVATVLAGATTAALLAGIVLVFRRRKGESFPEGLEGALLLTCIPLISPQGWDYVFLVSTPAVVYLLNYQDRVPQPLRIAALASVAIVGLSLFDLMGRAAYGTFMSWSIITVCYLTIVAALCVMRKRAAGPSIPDRRPSTSTSDARLL